MELFNVHRRDVYNFDDYMDLKKPGFGGPSSGKLLKDKNGKDINKDRKLQGYQNTVKRHDSFSNQVFNPTYKAMGGDLVHKQEQGKNPYDYPELYNNMGIATVNVGKANEGKCYTDFSSFIVESAKLNDECEDDCDCENCKESSNESIGFMAGGLGAAAMRSRSRIDDEYSSNSNYSSYSNDTDDIDDEYTEESKPEITLHDISMDNFGCEFWELDNDDDKKWCLAEYSKVNQQSDNSDDEIDQYVM